MASCTRGYRKRRARRTLGPRLRNMAVAATMTMLKHCFSAPCRSHAGLSRRASPPALKACAPAPPVRPAVLTATCSWPWSSPPKSWRSTSCGCGRRRRSCSRSYSCRSPRSRPSCLPPGGSVCTRAQGLRLTRCSSGRQPSPAFHRGAGPGLPGEGAGGQRPHLQA